MTHYKAYYSPLSDLDEAVLTPQELAGRVCLGDVYVDHIYQDTPAQNYDMEVGMHDVCTNYNALLPRDVEDMQTIHRVDDEHGRPVYLLHANNDQSVRIVLIKQ